MINAVILEGTMLSDNMVLLRELWNVFIRSYPSLQASDVLSSNKGSEKLYLCQVPPSLPRPSTNTRKNKFCVYIPLGNTSVELKKLLDGSDQFNEEIKSAKDIAAQVLVREFPFGYMYGDNDPPPLNSESLLRIVLPKNAPRCFCHIIPSEKPEPDTVDCWVTEDILRAMDFNFFIYPRPLSSGLVVIKVQ